MSTWSGRGFPGSWFSFRVISTEQTYLPGFMDNGLQMSVGELKPALPPQMDHPFALPSGPSHGTARSTDLDPPQLCCGARGAGLQHAAFKEETHIHVCLDRACGLRSSSCQPDTSPQCVLPSVVCAAALCALIPTVMPTQFLAGGLAEDGRQRSFATVGSREGSWKVPVSINPVETPSPHSHDFVAG